VLFRSRCIPFAGELEDADEPGECIFTGKPSPRRVVFAKAY
jgi:prolyl-tRNA synthetase